MNFTTIAKKLDPQGRADLAAFHEVRNRILYARPRMPRSEDIPSEMLEEYRQSAMNAAVRAGFPVSRNLVNDWVAFKELGLMTCQRVAEECWLKLMVEATSTAPKVVQGTLRLMKRNADLAILSNAVKQALEKIGRVDLT